MHHLPRSPNEPDRLSFALGTRDISAAFAAARKSVAPPPLAEHARAPATPPAPPAEASGSAEGDERLAPSLKCFSGPVTCRKSATTELRAAAGFPTAGSSDVAGLSARLLVPSGAKSSRQGAKLRRGVLLPGV